MLPLLLMTLVLQVMGLEDGDHTHLVGPHAMDPELDCAIRSLALDFSQVITPWADPALVSDALRLAIVPTISVIAMGFGSILSSAVFVETVFSRPGLGTLITGAVFKRNYPVVMGTVLVTTAFYLLVITAADLLIAKLDPRVRDALAE
jgi:hypothetical protein